MQMLTEVNLAAAQARIVPPVAPAGDPSQDNFPLKGVFGLMVAIGSIVSCSLIIYYLSTDSDVSKFTADVILSITQNIVLVVPTLGRSQIRKRGLRHLCCFLSLCGGSIMAVIAAIIVFTLKLPRWDEVCMRMAFILDLLAVMQLLVGGEVTRREADEEHSIALEDRRATSPRQ
jgi:hypothetical protein